MLVHSSITPSLTTRYYMYILYCSPCLETSYNILLHIATWWDTSIYILVVLHTLVYHLLRHSTTYTLVILAIYYWGALILTYHYLPIYSIALPYNTLHPIPCHTIYIYHQHH